MFCEPEWTQNENAEMGYRDILVIILLPSIMKFWTKVVFEHGWFRIINEKSSIYFVIVLNM